MYGTVHPRDTFAGRTLTPEIIQAHAWNSRSTPFDVVALAASAGGLPALRSVFSRLPSDYAAPILILQHRTDRHSEQDLLVELLNHFSDLKVLSACQGMHIEPGVAYVAPPGRHVLLSEERRIVLSDDRPVDHHRPSADLLFGCLAQQFGRRLMVAVLSGLQRDGAVGVAMVKACGGTVLVQEPETASCAAMPRAAISTGCADFVLPIGRIGDALTTLAMVPGATELFSRCQPHPRL